MEKFFGLLDPLFDYIDRGKLFRQPFCWFYYLVGVLCVVACFKGISNIFDMFDYLPGLGKFWAILVILLLLGGAVFSVIYWFKRAGQVVKIVAPGARFVAMPLVADFVRCLGEWFGILLGSIGSVACLFGLIFAAKYLGAEVGLGIIICPIIGFLFVVLFRFISEQILALASIANDVRELATFNPAEVN